MIILGSLFALPSASRAGENTWTTTGPYGSQISGLYIDPRNDQMMYATTATYVNGAIPIYKSTDGGITWHPSGTGIGSSSSASNYNNNHGMVFDKEDSNILYLVRSDGVYRSINGGGTWERKSRFVENGQLREIGGVTSVAVSPLDGVVFIGAPMEPGNVLGGIFRSADKGETWEHLEGLREKTIDSLVIAPSAPNIIYAGGSRVDGLYKSLDGGKTWASLGDAFGGAPSVHLITVDPNNSQIVYVAIIGAGLFRTADGGLTWQPIGVGINSDVRALVIDPNNQQVLYAGGAFAGVPGVYRSLDNTGTRWEFFSEGMGSRDVTSITLDRRTPQSIFAGSPAGVWKRTMTGESADFGVSINAGALFTNNSAIELTLTAPAGTDAMLLSNDGGFAGAQWEPLQAKRAWTITTFGTAVLPRIVYAKFRTEGAISGLYQDDIVLDQQKPTGSVQIVLPAPSTTGTIPSLSQDRPYHQYLPSIYRSGKLQLVMQATDDISGVADMRIASTSDFTNTQWQPYTSTTDWIMLDPQSTPVYVQFRDRAMNNSDPIRAIYTPSTP